MGWPPLRRYRGTGADQWGRWDMLDYIVYRSIAVFPAGDTADLSILDVSRRRNPLDGLTGFLHREEEYYFQFIEGPSDPLANLVHQLKGDRRHRSMAILRKGQQEVRSFGGWSMGKVGSGTTLLSNQVASSQLAVIQASNVIAFLKDAARKQATTASAAEPAPVICSTDHRDRPAIKRAFTQI